MSAGQPRHTQKERFRQRFMHKLVYFPDNNDGMFSCVGCGRCLQKCPQALHIVKVMKALAANGREEKTVNNRKEPLIPQLGVITDIRRDTPDVKTFRVVTPGREKALFPSARQCAMLSIPGVGEAMFSITSSPTCEEYMEFSIKKCGCVTDWAPQRRGWTAAHGPRTLRERLPCGGGGFSRKGSAVYRRGHRSCASALGDQLCAALSRPLREDRGDLRRQEP